MPARYANDTIYFNVRLKIIFKIRHCLAIIWKKVSPKSHDSININSLLIIQNGWSVKCCRWFHRLLGEQATAFKVRVNLTQHNF